MTSMIYTGNLNNMANYAIHKQWNAVMISAWQNTYRHSSFQSTKVPALLDEKNSGSFPV